MTFLNPAFLWAFLSLVPLVAFYFLKVRPRRKPTTAFFLWEQVFQEKRATSWLRRLRDFWSLLLMALALSAIVLALANPQWTDDERKDVLILIDNSASMNAREGSRTRLELAKDTAADIVRAFNGTQRAAVATIGHDLVYRSHLTDNPRQLLDAIEAIESSDQILQPKMIAASETGSQWAGDHRVMLITDGCFKRDNIPEHIELLKVGEPQGNIGIIAADMQYLPGADRQLGLYFQVASTHEQPMQADLLVSYQRGTDDEQLFKLIPLDIHPGVNAPQVFELENAPAGHWIAKLDVDDALASDDVAYLAVETPRPVRVAVDSDDRFFLENSVVAFSRGAGLLTLTGSDPQITLAKAVTPDAPRAIIFQPQGDSSWWSQLGDELDFAAPRLLVENHPALRYVEATAIPFVGARRLEPSQGAQVWVASDEGVPLIYYARQGDQSAIVVNMNPAAAEFYFSAWFPVFIHSAATFLAGREVSLLASYRPNEVVNIPGVQEDEKTKVVTPTGVQEEVTAKTLPLRNLGFYQLNNNSGNWLVACSLLSRDETLLDNEQIEDTSKPISRGWSPAHLLTVLAIVVLTVESLLYHRRKVG